MAELDILQQTKRYFTQHSEIYGKDIYVEADWLSHAENREAATLEEFYLEIKDCQKCPLSKSRTKFVFGVGNPKAELMCIGEGPGYDEDKMGEPFVGAAGRLLNKILSAIEFTREEVYIANIVKCRPPGNRDPEPEEISQCLPYLKRQIAMIAPKLILALGRVAAQSLLGSNEPLVRLRNRVHEFGDIRVVVTYHPAALLRNQQLKRETWNDVRKLRKIYDEIVADKPDFEASN